MTTGKLIGGDFVFTAANTRNQVMRGNFAEKSIKKPLVNTNVSVSRLDDSGLAVTPDGDYGLIGSNASPYLRVLDFEAEAWATPLSAAPTSVVKAIGFNAAGDEFAVGMGSTPFLLRYNYPGFVQQSAPGVLPSGAINGLSYGGGKLALALTPTPYFEIYDVATMVKDSFTPAASAPTAALLDIAMNSAGTLLATAGTNAASQGVRVWNYPSGTVAFVDTGIDNYSIEFSPDGTKLASLNATGTDYCTIYDTTAWTNIDISSVGQGYEILLPRVVSWIDNDFVSISNEYSIAIYNATTGALVSFVEWGVDSSVGKAIPSPLTVPRKLAGNVVDAALDPVARVVRAFHTETGRFVGETVSDAITGDFEMLIFTADLVTVFAIGAGGENARIYDPVTPAAWP